MNKTIFAEYTSLFLLKNRCKGTKNFRNVQEKNEILEKNINFALIFFRNVCLRPVIAGYVVHLKVVILHRISKTTANKRLAPAIIFNQCRMRSDANKRKELWQRKLIMRSSTKCSAQC